MSNRCDIKRLKVIGLHGYQDYDLRFDDSCLVLVGENGSGKTTVLKILYYFMIADWASLFSLGFKKATFTFVFQGTTHSVVFDRDSLNKSINKALLNECGNEEGEVVIDDDKRKELFQFFFEVHESDFSMIQFRKKTELSPQVGRKIEKELERSEAMNALRNAEQVLKECFLSHVLYLPTYRRIEEEMEVFFEEIDSLRGRRRRIQISSGEMIHFGMGDVEDAISAQQDELRNYSQRAQRNLTMSYLREILSKKYKEVSQKDLTDLTNKEIGAVLSRIDDEILNKDEKRQIEDTINRIANLDQSELTDQDKIIAHYFIRLRDFDYDLEKREERFTEFSNICNMYLLNNKVKYSRQDMTCYIEEGKLEAGRDDVTNQFFHDLSQNRARVLKRLSSGEKQIVAIFSKLILEEKPDMFVLIDEPELSLSIEWQQQLLPHILNSSNCCGIVAVTHSPFIFDNAVEKYVRGIEEFAVGGGAFVE